MNTDSLFERAGYALSAHAAPPAPAIEGAAAADEIPPERDNKSTAISFRALFSAFVEKLPAGKHGIAALIGLLLIIIVGPTAALFASGEAMQPHHIRYSDPSMGDAERAESNFPGSAFYFLASDQTEADIGIEESANDNVISNAMIGEPDALSGPAAMAFKMAQSGSDYNRALKCLTDAIYYEAALEPDEGQRAVAQVILNRVRHPSYPNTLCGVIYQGSERATGCQFSYSCDGSMARTPSRFYWERAGRVAKAALDGSVYAPVGLATHYHTTEVNPYWAPSLKFLRTVGAHRFYSFKGNAGQPSAFFRKYAGSEPLPQPHPRRASLVAATGSDKLDPGKLQSEFARKYAKLQEDAEKQLRFEAKKRAEAEERARLNADDLVARGPAASTNAQVQHAAPDYSAGAAAYGGDSAFKASRLPGAGGVKAQYAESGSWKY